MPISDRIVFSLDVNEIPFVNGLKNAYSTLSGYADQVFKAFATAGVATTAAIGLAVREASQFSDSITQSMAIMNSEARKMENTFRDAAIGVSTSTRFSAQEAGEAYYFLASAGLDAAQQVDALPKVAEFATAGMFDLSTATDLLTDAQSAMGLSVSDASQNIENMSMVADVLVKANTLANASVQQFSESLTTGAAAAARTAGISLEEVTAVLAALADQGTKGARAGTLFSTALRDLTTKSIENRDAFDALNIQVFDAQGNFAGFPSILRDMEAAMGAMSVEQQRATLLQLGFTAESVKAISALTGLSEKVAGYEVALKDAGGTTEEVADRQLNSFAAQMDLAKSAIQNFSIEIGEAYESFTPFIKAFAWAVNGVTKLIDNLPLIGDRMKVLVGQFAAFIPIAYGIWKAIGFVKIGQIIRGFIPLVVKIGTVASKAINRITQGIGIVAVKFGQFFDRLQQALSRFGVRVSGIVTRGMNELNLFIVAVERNFYRAMHGLSKVVQLLLVQLDRLGIDGTAAAKRLSAATMEVQQHMVVLLNGIQGLNVELGYKFTRSTEKAEAEMKRASRNMTGVMKRFQATVDETTVKIRRMTNPELTSVKRNAERLGQYYATPFKMAQQAATGATKTVKYFQNVSKVGFAGAAASATKASLSINRIGGGITKLTAGFRQMGTAWKGLAGVAASLALWEIGFGAFNKIQNFVRRDTKAAQERFESYQRVLAATGESTKDLEEKNKRLLDTYIELNSELEETEENIERTESALLNNAQEFGRLELVTRAVGDSLEDLNVNLGLNEDAWDKVNSAGNNVYYAMGDRGIREAFDLLRRTAERLSPEMQVVIDHLIAQAQAGEISRKELHEIIEVFEDLSNQQSKTAQITEKANQEYLEQAFAAKKTQEEQKMLNEMLIKIAAGQSTATAEVEKWNAHVEARAEAEQAASEVTEEGTVILAENEEQHRSSAEIIRERTEALEAQYAAELDATAAVYDAKVAEDNFVEALGEAINAHENTTVSVEDQNLATQALISQTQSLGQQLLRLPAGQARVLLAQVRQSILDLGESGALAEDVVDLLMRSLDAIDGQVATTELQVSGLDTIANQMAAAGMYEEAAEFMRAHNLGPFSASGKGTFKLKRLELEERARASFRSSVRPSGGGGGDGDTEDDTEKPLEGLPLLRRLYRSSGSFEDGMALLKALQAVAPSADTKLESELDLLDEIRKLKEELQAETLEGSEQVTGLVEKAYKELEEFRRAVADGTYDPEDVKERNDIIWELQNIKNALAALPNYQAHQGNIPKIQAVFNMHGADATPEAIVQALYLSILARGAGQRIPGPPPPPPVLPPPPQPDGVPA